MAKLLSMVIDGQTLTVSGDPKVWTAAELNAVERYTGMTVDEFAAKLDGPVLSSLAVSALAWVAVRRAGSFVPWDAFVETLHVMELVQTFKRVDTDEPADATAATA